MKIESKPFQGGSRKAYNAAITEIRTAAAKHLGLTGQVRIRPGTVLLSMAASRDWLAGSTTAGWIGFSRATQVDQIEDVVVRPDRTFKVSIEV